MSLRPHFALILGTDTLKYQPHPDYGDYLAEINDPRVPASLDTGSKIPIPVRNKETESKLIDRLDVPEEREETDRAINAIIIENWMRSRSGVKRETGCTEIELYHLLFHDSEHSLPQIMGIILDDTGAASNVHYAMMAAFDLYEKPGYKFLPSIGIGEDTSQFGTLVLVRDRILETDAERAEFDERHSDMQQGIAWKRTLMERGQNHLYFSLDMQTYQMYAAYVFKHAGITIDPQELRLMLVWYWS